MSNTLNRTLNRHPCSDTLTRPASTEMQGLPLPACTNDHIDPQILRKTHSLKHYRDMNNIIETAKERARDEGREEGVAEEKTHRLRRDRRVYPKVAQWIATTCDTFSARLLEILGAETLVTMSAAMFALEL